MLRPPNEAIEVGGIVFLPASGLRDWVYENLIKEGGGYFNPYHAHLVDANVCFLWTNQINTRRGRMVVGQAEEMVFRCGAWQKYRQQLQILDWFGDIPDFLITLDANYCADCPAEDLLALIEHELYHCAQKLDEFGQPKFSRDTGLPLFTLVGHDVEEFVGVVRRYGVGGADGYLARLVDAAGQAPEISPASAAKMCANCN